MPAGVCYCVRLTCVSFKLFRAGELWISSLRPFKRFFIESNAFCNSWGFFCVVAWANSRTWITLFYSGSNFSSGNSKISGSRLVDSSFVPVVSSDARNLPDLWLVMAVLPLEYLFWPVLNLRNSHYWKQTFWLCLKCRFLAK